MTPVLFIHGNCSSSAFWRPFLAELPRDLRAIAPDLRGFGDNPQPIDATRGLSDLVDDCCAAIDRTIGDAPCAVVGHSVGGGVAMALAMRRPAQIRSLALIAPMSPFGFGATRDEAGTPTNDDWAGSGAGTANPEFATRIANRDRTSESALSPRSVLREFYFDPSFRSPDEESLLDSVLTTRVGEDWYPGDVAPAASWPFVGPGTRGMNNALSPKHGTLAGFADHPERPPVLWLRGDRDRIVSDTSLFCFGHLGALGVVPGWPGADAFPAQPMVAQTRYVLERYRARGGRYREEVIAGAGHSPHLERPAAVLGKLVPFLREGSARSVVAEAR